MTPPRAASGSFVNGRLTQDRSDEYLHNEGLKDLTSRIKNNSFCTPLIIRIDHKKTSENNSFEPLNGYELISEDVFVNFCDVLLTKNPKIENFEFWFMYDQHLIPFTLVLNNCFIATAKIGILSSASVNTLSAFFESLKILPDSMRIYIAIKRSSTEALHPSESYKFISKSIESLSEKKNFTFTESILPASMEKNL